MVSESHKYCFVGTITVGLLNFRMAFLYREYVVCLLNHFFMSPLEMSYRFVCTNLYSLSTPPKDVGCLGSKYIFSKKSSFSRVSIVSIASPLCFPQAFLPNFFWGLPTTTRLQWKIWFTRWWWWWWCSLKC